MGDARVESAKRAALFSIKNNEFLYYLIGTPLYRISGRNGVDGGFSQDFATTVEAIYGLYGDRPDLHVDMLMESEIEKLFGRRFLSSEIIPVLEELKYHLLKEKQQEAPFHIDCEKLFTILSKNIQDHSESYEKVQYSQSHNLMEMLRDSDKFLQDNVNTGFISLR